MAISRSLMNRQLQANGGIMDVSPREKFGLGSSLKKFVRKIIPNEVAEIAVKAAPFVAPFNPAIAAAMGGLGTFDQTGSISDSLKRGALTYGLGQGARFLGGAGLQGNPFSMTGGATGGPGAFRGGFEGFKSGFSSPLGAETGFKLGEPVEAVKDVGVSEGSYLPFQGEEMSIPNYSEQLDIIQKGSPRQISITESIKKIVGPESTLNERGTEALNLLKRGTKAAFTKPDGKGGTMIDTAAVIGAVTFAASYAEAKALANQAGVDITEEEYDEAQRDAKKAEYADDLKNFFAGKKDGGRIGFEQGTAPSGIFTLGDYARFLETAGDFNKLYDEGEDVVAEAGEFVKKIGDKEYDDMSFLERYEGDKIEDKLETLEKLYMKNMDKYDDEYGIEGRDIPDPDAMGAYARELIRDLNRRDKKLNVLAEKAGLKNGGRIGYARGTDLQAGAQPITIKGDIRPNNMMMASETPEEEFEMDIMSELMQAFEEAKRQGYKGSMNDFMQMYIGDVTQAPKGIMQEAPIRMMAKGGSMNDEEDEDSYRAGVMQAMSRARAMGGGMPMGIMRTNEAGVMERDYRDKGGFVPVGIKEKADDVPAMLSKNEFVFTADAVRGAGNGSVEKGAQKMYDTMKSLEKKVG